MTTTTQRPVPPVPSTFTRFEYLVLVWCLLWLCAWGGVCLLACAYPNILLGV